MRVWQDFQFHRLVRVPREAARRQQEDGTPPGDVQKALLASLTGSHADLLASGHPGAAIMASWVRSPHDRQLRVFVGGRPYFPPAVGPAGARRAVLFPPGALASDLPDRVVGGLLDAFPYWVPCRARDDALWMEPGAKGRSVPRRGSFDQHAAHLREPFAWLVLAEPMPPVELKPELDRLVNEILPLSRGEVSEAKRVALERKQARHRELSRLQEGGFWRIRVLVGGEYPRSASSAAAMLCAASELDGLPYELAPCAPPTSLAAAAGGAVPDFPASTELLAALTRPPSRELPGLRLVEPHTFDVTPEATGSEGLVLGTVRDEADADVGDLALTTGALNRHTFVCGATGGGKSQTVRHLLEQATRVGLPWLVVEPAKAEYARMATRIADLGAGVVVIRPSDAETAPAGLNPLEPAPGFPLQTHADLLRALFLASFQQHEPLPQILAAAIKRCYEELGWDLALGEPVHAGHRPRYPTLGDLQRVAEQVVGEVGYGKEVAADVRGFIRVRIASLRLGTTGRFFEGGHPLDFARLLTRNVVLEIEDVGDDADKAFLMGAVLMRLVEHLRVTTRGGPAASGLRHITVVEEAHRLLRRPEPGAAGAAAHAVEMFAALLAEVRAYGEGLVIAEQIPSKLVPDVIKNTAVKIVHRLPASDDRESVGATMNVDESQSRYLVTLTPGEAAVFMDGMDRPVLVRVPPDGVAREAGPQPPTAPIHDLIGRRSATCGQSCMDIPCALREMRAAQHLLADQTWISLWAELAVLGHLVGRAAPVPRPELLVTFAGLRVPQRTVDCAVAHAVEDAVAVRSGTLQETTSPTDLAEHVALALRRVLAGKDSGCAGDAMRYLAHMYRWDAVRCALATDPAGEGRDPRTAQWEAQYRRPIPGETRAAQRDAVSAWLLAEWEDVARREAVTYGARRPSTLDKAVGALDGGRRERVMELLGQFVDGTWAVGLLMPDDDPARP